MELSKQQRLEIGRDAKALLENPTFDRVITHLTAKYINVLVAEQVGTLTANSAHATLRALKDFKEALSVLASEVAVQTRSQKE